MKKTIVYVLVFLMLMMGASATCPPTGYDGSTTIYAFDDSRQLGILHYKAEYDEGDTLPSRILFVFENDFDSHIDHDSVDALLISVPDGVTGGVVGSSEGYSTTATAFAGGIIFEFPGIPEDGCTQVLELTPEEGKEDRMPLGTAYASVIGGSGAGGTSTTGYTHEIPEFSTVGIIIAVLAIVAISFVFYKKKMSGKKSQAKIAFVLIALLVIALGIAGLIMLGDLGEVGPTQQPIVSYVVKEIMPDGSIEERVIDLENTLGVAVKVRTESGKEAIGIIPLEEGKHFIVGDYEQLITE